MKTFITFFLLSLLSISITSYAKAKVYGKDISHHRVTCIAIDKNGHTYRASNLATTASAKHDKKAEKLAKRSALDSCDAMSDSHTGGVCTIQQCVKTTN